MLDGVYTKAYFDHVPYYDGSDPGILDRVDSLVIIPTGETDPDNPQFGRMTYCLMDSDMQAICKITPHSDILLLDGYGGIGPHEPGEDVQALEPKAWRVDCLAGCGYLRVFARGMLRIPRECAVPIRMGVEVYAE